MSETPYAPPTARVADPQAVRPPKPVSIHRAVICLWVSAAGTVVSAAFHASILTIADVVVLAITAGLLALVAAKVSAGRSWARWLFLVVWALGSLSGMAMVVLMPQAFRAWPSTVQAIAILQFVIQTAALALLFTRASREWFVVPDATSTTNAR
jgi:hypothetical protein